MGIAVVHYFDKASNCSEGLRDAIFNINHTGQTRCGVVLNDGNDFYRVTRNGLVNELKIPGGLKGHYGVGSVSKFQDHQPLIFYPSKLPRFALTFDGYIVNRDALRSKMDAFLSPFDPELAGRIISQGDDFVGGIKKLAKAMKGCYCLGIVTEEGVSYAARCPLATKPLMLGSGKRGHAAITESRAFRKIGMTPTRDFKPGEIVKMDENGAYTIDIIEGEGRKICTFLWGYKSWVDSVIEGIPVNRVRERVAAKLAEKDKKDGLAVDRVTAIEDSGIAYGQGYAFHAELPYFSIAIKYPYAPRSYDEPAEKRVKVAKSKHSTVDDRVKGQRLVVCDDSLRRGTVTEGGPIDYLKEAGAKEIHVRFGTPRNRFYCRFDYIDAPDDTLPANRYPTDEALAELWGVNSVKFPDEDEFIAAIIEDSNLTRDDLCLGCYKSGNFSFLE